MAENQSHNPQIARESRLHALYGDKLPRNRLLKGQLKERFYFDSGDHAVSQAHRSTNIGEVDTGVEHPLREHISHPVSAVPASSNVSAGGVDMNTYDGQRSTEVNNESSLHEQVSRTQVQDENTANISKVKVHEAL
ncbi:hypothetical protein ACQRIU_002428 [Beauveria bassiana]